MTSQMRFGCVTTNKTHPVLIYCNAKENNRQQSPQKKIPPATVYIIFIVDRRKSPETSTVAKC